MCCCRRCIQNGALPNTRNLPCAGLRAPLGKTRLGGAVRGGGPPPRPGVVGGAISQNGGGWSGAWCGSSRAASLPGAQIKQADQMVLLPGGGTVQATLRMIRSRATRRGLDFCGDG